MENYQQAQQPYGRPTPPPTPYIGFGDAIQICFNKYATFSGRATRAEYWWWYLFTFIVSAVLSWLPSVGIGGSICFGLINLALVIPTLAVSWRRMHDIGKGGGYYFINLIPLVGQILWTVWCCKESEPFDNRFGPRP